MAFCSWSLTPVVSHTMRRIEGERKLKAAEARFLLFCNCNKCSFGTSNLGGKLAKRLEHMLVQFHFPICFETAPRITLLLLSIAYFWSVFPSKSTCQRIVLNRFSKKFFFWKRSSRCPFSRESDIAAAWKMCSLKTLQGCERAVAGWGGKGPLAAS